MSEAKTTQRRMPETKNLLAAMIDNESYCDEIHLIYHLTFIKIN